MDRPLVAKRPHPGSMLLVEYQPFASFVLLLKMSFCTFCDDRLRKNLNYN